MHTLITPLPGAASVTASIATLLLASLVGTSTCAAHPDADAEAPNILLITADNLGYGDLRCYNERSPVHTPNLNQLAREGTKLTRFYTASPTCTVSRACLLTGRIAQRHGLTDQLSGVAGNYGVGLDHDEVLIPQVLHEAPAGYVTGCFGKWNIGFANGSRPTERGFDEFLGHASGNLDYYRHNYRDQHDLYAGRIGEDIRPLHREGEYSTDLFAAAAAEFIHRHSPDGRPWFCYLPFNAPHFPVAGNKPEGEPNRWQAPDRAFEKYTFGPSEDDPTRRYYAVVTALDEAIGRVLAALESAGVADSTFVFFMSDNGAFRLGRTGLDVGSNAPLRSGGVTCWEGGLRVPAIARWPGKIPSNAVVAQPLWSPDLFVTCAKMADAKLPQGVPLDGRDMLPILISGAAMPDRSFYFEYRTHSALTDGDWKIVREKPDRPWQLFHLSQDPKESTNLAEQQPERVARLLAERARWQTSLMGSADRDDP